jgi:hypothetical protein
MLLKTESLSTFPLCGAGELLELFRALDSYLDPLILQRCQTCAQVFLSPRLTPEAIVEVENGSAVYQMAPAQQEETIAIVDGLVAWLESFGRLPGS